MSGTRTTLIAALFLTGAIALAGCTSQPVPAPTVKPPAASGTSKVATPQASVEPTATKPYVSSGPITSPKSGSEERKALLDAARERLATKSSFYVYQVYVQGDRALADIESTAKGDVNGRIVVAFEKTAGKWTAIAAVKYGSSAATAANTARALPSFSSQLINTFKWNLAKPSNKSSEVSQATLLKGLSSAAQKWSDTAMSGKGAPYKVTVVKVAQDAKGGWWGHAVVQPTGDANNSYEALDYWAQYSAGDWQGKLQDPEPPAPTTYFPAAVVSKLAL